MQRASKSPASPGPVEPVDVVMSVFTARRDLMRAVRHALGESGLTVEEADILVLLYGVTKLGWKEDCQTDAERYVTFRDLQAALVHEPSGFSRRVQPLEKQGLVETDVVRDPAAGLHGNSRRVRITRKGVSRIRPVFERYAARSAELLKGFARKDLQICVRLLDHISRRCRPATGGEGQ